MTKKQRATTPGAGRRILTPPPCRWSIPPTTEEWGEGGGEGIPISRANSMEGAPLPSPLPARASQGEGAGAFHDGGSVQMRPELQFYPGRTDFHFHVLYSSCMLVACQA